MKKTYSRYTWEQIVDEIYIEQAGLPPIIMQVTQDILDTILNAKMNRTTNELALSSPSVGQVVVDIDNIMLRN